MYSTLRMPLQVTIDSPRAVEPLAPTFPERAVDTLTTALSSACTDSWRRALLRTAATASRFTCAQAARVLRCIDGADSAAAVRLLLRAVVDVAAVGALEAAALPDDLQAAWRTLGVHAEICSANPCGHYRLDLSLQVRQAANACQLAQRVPALG